MPHFVKGYLRKKYGVRPLTTQFLLRGQALTQLVITEQSRRRKKDNRYRPIDRPTDRSFATLTGMHFEAGIGIG